MSSIFSHCTFDICDRLASILPSMEEIMASMERLIRLGKRRSTWRRPVLRC